MNFKTYYILILFVGFIFFGSCKKNSPSPSNSNNNQTIANNPFAVTDTTVFIVGNVSSTKSLAVYWKNNTLGYFSNTVRGGVATSVVSSAGNLYAIGTCIAGNGNQVAAYWKNGVLTKLTDSAGSILEARATGIQVVGNDVYIAGTLTYSYAGQVPSSEIFLWINGVMTNLYTSTSSRSGGVAILGSDVYVAGNNGYWKNKTFISLPNASSVFGITINGNDVYIVGQSIDPSSRIAVPLAAYWKNGILTSVNTNYSAANSMAVQGTDVYLSGQTVTGLQLGMYWKNGVATTIGDPKSAYSSATGIAVHGKDLYIVGTDGSKGAFIWKNGVTTFLYPTTSLGNSSNAYDIIVVNP